MKKASEILTHLDASGNARMVDVGEKRVTRREARASARVVMRPETLQAIVDRSLPKGDVFAVARIAGIQAAKRTSDLIPLCHPLPLTSIALDLRADTDLPGVEIVATCGVDGKTGVEMEALTAVSVAALALYDMCKAIDRSLRIEAVELLEKRGGKSDWVAD